MIFRNQVHWKTIEVSPSLQKFILKPLSELLVVCNTCTTIVPRGDFAIHLSNCYTSMYMCEEKVVLIYINYPNDCDDFLKIILQLVSVASKYYNSM
jgi:hypothetical protein